MSTAVVPPLYFGHLSYTPPPGYSGYIPGVQNVPPGFNYKTTLRTSRKDALYKNPNNPEVWIPLSSRGHALQSRQHDPVSRGQPLGTNPISGDEGLMPGYCGHVPHVRSNCMPGYSFKNLTRNKGLLARTSVDQIFYMTEQRQAFQETAEQLRREISDETDSLVVPEEEPQLEYEQVPELSPKELAEANATWIEFHSKMESHFRVPSVAFRRMDEERKGYLSPANVRKGCELVGIFPSPSSFRALMKGLGCNASGLVNILDFMKACEFSLPEALKQVKPSSSQTARSSRDGSKDRSLRPVVSQESSMVDLSGESRAGSGKELPYLVFTPRIDPMVERVFNKSRGNAKNPEPSIPAKPQMRFGLKAIPGYLGHQPQWRTPEWEDIQHQLSLRVKPQLRMKQPRMRSLQDELDEQCSKELKEAKAAWKLILDNFEEFKKVQTAFRLVDKDFSGVISREELRKLIEEVLYIVVSDAAFDIIFKTMDKDGSGELSFDEFAAAITNPDVELTDTVSDTAEAKAAQARREMIKASTQQVKLYDVGASASNILYAKNENLVVKGKSFIIQNLRKKLDKRFYEIRTALAMHDPTKAGVIPTEDFIRVLRLHKLCPEGGEQALQELCSLLQTDNGIDYFELERCFGALDPSLQMADDVSAVKAQVDRHLKNQFHLEEGEVQEEEGWEQESNHDGADDINWRSKTADIAFNNVDVSRKWQDPSNPGRPSAQARNKFQKKAKTLGMKIANESRVPSGEVRAVNAPFKVKKIHTIRDGNSEEKFPDDIQSPSILTREGSAVKNEGNQDEPVMYGVKLRKAQKAPRTQILASNFSADVLTRAEEIWTLLRKASQATHGSMQRAFRSVDKDGSGRIELGELQQLIRKNLSIEAEDDEISCIFDILDIGSKGSITYTDFARGLLGPLNKSGDTAMETEYHPIDSKFGKRLVSQKPPPVYENAWNKTISVALHAGDNVLQNGASTTQLGDRYAWKAAGMYKTTSAVMSVSQEDKEASKENSVVSKDHPAERQGPLSKYAKQAGVQFVLG